MENNLPRLVSVSWIIEHSGGIFTKNAIRDWDRIEGAPKSVKLGGSANSPRAYLESEFREYVIKLVERRSEARAAASKAALRAGMYSVASRAALAAEKRGKEDAKANPKRKPCSTGAKADAKQATV